MVPSVYGQLPIGKRHSVARLIGRVMHAEEPSPPKTIMLIGPGRWGTTTPSLGVPVSFAEIDRVSALCEIVAMREDLVPDVSLGTHFFNELVELDILYLALFPGRPGNGWNTAILEKAPNRLLELVPEADRLVRRGPGDRRRRPLFRRGPVAAQCERPEAAGGVLSRRGRRQ